MIASNWKFTFDPSGTPLVLVAIGQMIEDEPQPSLDLPVETVSLVDSAAPFLRVSGNAVVSFSFRVFTENAATDAAARAAMLDALVAAQTMARKPLRIEISGNTTHYWQFANATVTRHTPRRVTAGHPMAVATEWSITATGLGKHAVTPP